MVKKSTYGSINLPKGLSFKGPIVGPCFFYYLAKREKTKIYFYFRVSDDNIEVEILYKILKNIDYIFKKS